jgi:hypothetical protein
MIALWCAGGNQVIAILGQGLGRKKLQLSGFVAAESQPGLIVTFDK